MYIDRKEALRYMGYRGQKIADNLQCLLDDCIDEVMDISKNSFIYEIFDIERREDGLCMKGSTLILRGEAIHAHLQKAEKCAVMAVTLGLEVDRRIAFYSKTDLTKSLVFDACAAAAVESLCDIVQSEIASKAMTMELEITSRFSPGYGDFSIDIQREIAKVLKTYEKIGLSVNESSIMIPRKSVTAVISLQYDKCSVKSHKCNNCEDKYCLYRKDGADDEQQA
ncbi:MAG TPA: vitamin B12 dependent-methionine synthase activation domain-containing protein [Clostridia bacterium]|nr:vitamin B12 dependent-methionine synthase activation domain-containing protein [Clostridia bacterium]